MRRTVVTLAVVGLFVACGFPDVTYTDGTDGGTDGTSHVDGPIGAEGSGGDDADSSMNAETGTDSSGTDGDATADAPGDSSAVDSSSDATDGQPGDSGADVHEAAADAPPDCDVDMDNYKATGATCGGNDCCDTDNMAHPNQTTFFTQADKCGSFDYNCNGTPDPQYPVNLKCGGTGLTGCTGGSAFLGNPACGASALYGTCVPNGALACQAGNEMTVQQGCN